MNYKFVLRVKYGTGDACMLTNKPDIGEAIEEFKREYGKNIPDTKMYGLPNIILAELLPLLKRSS